MVLPAAPNKPFSFVRSRPLLLAIALATTLVARSGLSDPPPSAAAPSAVETVATASQTVATVAPPVTPQAGDVGNASAAPTIQAADIKSRVADLLADAKSWGGTASAMVIEVQSGAVLASGGAHLPMNPASNAKLATAAAALHVFGPDHRFLTGLYGKIVGDRIATLVLRSFADPTLTSNDLRGLVHELFEKGVRKVGDVQVDQSYFDDVFTPPAFAQQPNEWAPFRAPIAAVSVNANTVFITAEPGAEGKPATIKVNPPGIAVVTGTVKTTKKNDPEKFGLSASAGSGGPGGSALTLHVSGHVPFGGLPITTVRRLEDPRIAAGFSLKRALIESGIEVTGSVEQGGQKEKGLLVAHRSETLAHILSKLGKDSDNFVAEMVFKALASEKKGRPGTFLQAKNVVGEELTALSAFEAGCVIENGSGLFDANRTTAYSTTKLLQNSYLDSKTGPEMVAQLAVGGVDGTLRSRFKKWAKARAIRAKTGTLNAAFALSGYVLSPPGKPTVAFSLFINDAKGKAGPGRAAMDKVVDAIAKALWGNAAP